MKYLCEHCKKEFDEDDLPRIKESHPYGMTQAIEILIDLSCSDCGDQLEELN